MQASSAPRCSVGLNVRWEAVGGGNPCIAPIDHPPMHMVHCTLHTLSLCLGLRQHILQHHTLVSHRTCVVLCVLLRLPTPFSRHKPTDPNAALAIASLLHLTDKMLQIFKELDLAVPADVTVSISSRVFTVKGPRGTLTKVSIPVLPFHQSTFAVFGHSSINSRRSHGRPRSQSQR